MAIFSTFYLNWFACLYHIERKEEWRKISSSSLGISPYIRISELFVIYDPHCISILGCMLLRVCSSPWSIWLVPKTNRQFVYKCAIYADSLLELCQVQYIHFAKFRCFFHTYMYMNMQLHSPRIIGFSYLSRSKGRNAISITGTFD